LPSRAGRSRARRPGPQGQVGPLLGGLHPSTRRRHRKQPPHQEALSWLHRALVQRAEKKANRYHKQTGRATSLKQSLGRCQSCARQAPSPRWASAAPRNRQRIQRTGVAAPWWHGALATWQRDAAAPLSMHAGRRLACLAGGSGQRHTCTGSLPTDHLPGTHSHDTVVSSTAYSCTAGTMQHFTTEPRQTLASERIPPKLGIQRATD